MKKNMVFVLFVFVFVLVTPFGVSANNLETVFPLEGSGLKYYFVQTIPYRETNFSEDPQYFFPTSGRWDITGGFLVHNSSREEIFTNFSLICLEHEEPYLPPSFMCPFGRDEVKFNLTIPAGSTVRIDFGTGLFRASLRMEYYADGSLWGRGMNTEVRGKEDLLLNDFYKYHFPDHN